MSIFVAVARLAAEAGLHYLVVGGNAVIAHGYQRGTKDFDLLVVETEVPAWDSLIRSLEYVSLQKSHAFHMYVPVARGTAPIDLVIVDAPTFAKFTAQPESTTIEGVPVEVPRLSHLLALKLHALKRYQAHRYERDMGDVIALMRLHSVDLANPEYAVIFERYATAAVRKEVERRLVGPEPTDR